MLRDVIAVTVSFTLLWSASVRPDTAKGELRPITQLQYVPNELIVKFTGRGAMVQGGAMAADLNASIKEEIPDMNAVILRIPDGSSLDEAKNSLEQKSGVEYVQYNFIYHNFSRPNDAHFDSLWGMSNSGQSVGGDRGTQNADIRALSAWDVTIGSEEVVIAVVDDGVYRGHEDLAANMWVNADDPINGVDDDNNGFVDDYYGWDFVQNDNDPAAGKHGTHVAGTIAAVGNNGIGVAGVCWKAKIMAVRALGENGGLTADLIKAVKYAVDNGARIINASWGGPGYDQMVYDAVKYARDKGVLFVCAAGNDGVNIDVTPYTPGSFDLENVITVAATDKNDRLASFSNYGAIGVDVAAPGVKIFSTVPASSTGNVLFQDNMEDGSNWWTNGYWQLTQEACVSPTHSATDSPGGTYQNNQESCLMLVKPLSFAPGSQPVLDFQLRLDTESQYDWLFVDACVDGYSWSIIDGRTGTTSGQFVSVRVPLSVLEGYAQVYLRFRLSTDASTCFDGAYIDDVIITANGGGSGSEWSYEYIDGTSMASPHVAGLAGLILSQNLNTTFADLRRSIFNSVDGLTQLQGKVVSGGRINAVRALANTLDVSEPNQVLPSLYVLGQNYPNPFNPTTTIEYSLPSQTKVTIEVFNVIGQKVRTLVNETMSAGSYQTEWNGTDDKGSSVSTGVYLYRLSAGEVVQMKKMLLLK